MADEFLVSKQALDDERIDDAIAALQNLVSQGDTEAVYQTALIYLKKPNADVRQNNQIN